MDPITNSSTPAEFKLALSNIDWFSHIGDETEYPYSICDWEDWPGPEDPTVMPLGSWQQELYDGLLASAGDKATELKELWDEVLHRVLQTASETVPLMLTRILGTLRQRLCGPQPGQRLWSFLIFS